MIIIQGPGVQGVDEKDGEDSGQSEFSFTKLPKKTSPIHHWYARIIDTDTGNLNIRLGEAT